MEEDVTLKTALMEAARKKAVGYETSECVDEYSLLDGELTLVKRRVCVKEVPPDVAAVKFMLEMCSDDIDGMTEQQLHDEKLRLIKLLKEDKHEACKSETVDALRDGRVPEKSGVHDKNGPCGNKKRD